MRTSKLIILFVLLTFKSHSQQKIVINYDDRPNTSRWWVDNTHVKFHLDEKMENQQNPGSKVCLNVRWDSIPTNKSWCWFTDLKIDSLANPVMDRVRTEFGDQIWLSCWCNSGIGDSVYVQPLMLTRGHKGKWGAKKMVGLSSSKWVFLKFKLADLEYENWGKIPGLPNLKSDEIRCFELGLRNGKISAKGFIDARFDDLMISNYEPFPNKSKK